MNEKVLFESRTHPKVLFKPFVIQLLLLALHVLAIMLLPTDTGWDWWNAWGPLCIHGLIVILEVWYVVVPVAQWLTSTFTLTNMRVLKKWGLLYKHSREITLDHVVSVSTERGIIDRIFGAGTLVFMDASSSSSQTHGAWNKKVLDKGGVRFTDIPKVEHVRKLADKARFS